VPPGTPGAFSQVTGNEHDEWGHVTVNPTIRNKMMGKRMEKMRLAKPDLPIPHLYGDPKAKIGFVGFGSTWGPIRETQEILRARGVPTNFYQARTLYPVPVETLAPFLDGVDVAYIVEHNYTGQLHRLIRETIPQHHAKLRSILKYDGLSFRSSDLLAEIREA